MSVGLHLSSWGTVEDKDIAWLKTIGAKTVTLLDGASRSDVLRIKEALPNIKILVRLYQPRGPLVYSDALLEGFVAHMNVYYPTDRELVHAFIVLNEPDEDHNMTAFQAKMLFALLRPALKKACPWAKLLLPGPSVQAGKIEWWKDMKDLVPLWDGLAEHAYWQTAETRLYPEFGGRFKELHALYPDKEIWLTEVGWKTGLGQLVDTTAEAKGRLYRQWATEVSGYPYVKGITFYRTVAEVETRPIADVEGELEITQPLINALAGPMPAPGPIPPPPTSLWKLTEGVKQSGKRWQHWDEQ